MLKNFKNHFFFNKNNFMRKFREKISRGEILYKTYQKIIFKRTLTKIS